MSEIASSNAQVNIADVNEAGDVIFKSGEFPEYEEEKEEQLINEPPFNYVVRVYDDPDHRTTRKVDVFADIAEVNEVGDAIFYAEVLRDVPVMRSGLFGVRKPGLMETIERVPVACYAAGSYESFVMVDVKTYGPVDPADFRVSGDLQ